jgi:hypothetical protein
MNSTGRVIGWKLDRDQRDELLKRFPPRYADVMADHVTLRTNAGQDELPDPVDAAIIGRADDGDSLECMVATIDGTFDRPDGSTFHITWSIDRSKGREARESNDLLREGGWTRWPETVPVSVEPARWP